MKTQVLRMNEIVQSYVADNQFMGSILVAQHGKIIMDKAYGFANIEWQIPNATDTKFRLGSITKQFTAASILLLEEQGFLKISDLLSKHMPDIPAAWKNITIFHLITHTSGIPNYTAFPDFQDFVSTIKPVTPMQQIKLFINKPLHFEPGSKFDYCNSGYVILGYLIEKISGKRYQNFIADNIFKKHGMIDSGYDSSSEIILRRASGYETSQNGLINTSYLNCSIPYSAGSTYSTTHDLLQWQQKLFDGKVLSPDSLKKMITPFKDDYGLGLFIQSIHGQKLISHGGGINGFKTFMVYSPEDQSSVIVLNNLITVGFVPQNIGLKLLKLSHGKTVKVPSERKEISVLPEIPLQYVGTYELSTNLSMKNNITISLKGGNLIASITHQPNVRLFPESDTRFFSRIPDMQIEFLKNKQGEFTDIVLCQDEEDIKGVKVINK